MNRNGTIFRLLLPILIILCFAGCKGETAKTTMKDFLIDELWDMETDALHTLIKLQGISDDRTFALVCEDSMEKMTKVKTKLDNYTGEDESVKNLINEQQSYCDFFLQSVTHMGKKPDITAISAIIKMRKTLLEKRNLPALEIMKGIDINDDNGRKYIDQYLENTFMNATYFHLTSTIMDNPGYRDSVPLRYIIAELKHFEKAGEEEYKALMRFKESSGLSGAIKEWISKRLYYLELYNNCGTPAYWTMDKIKIEKGFINSQVKTGMNIYDWLTTCYEKGEYLLAENLAQLFVNKKQVITTDGTKIPGAEYMESNDFDHFPELSKFMDLLNEFTGTFIARNFSKTAGYIKGSISIHDYPGYGGVYTRDEFMEYAGDLSGYLESRNYSVEKHEIDGNNLHVEFNYSNPSYDDVYVEIKCYFEKKNSGILLTTIEPEYKIDGNFDVSSTQSIRM